MPYPWQIQQPNLAEVFFMAQQSRRADQEQAMRQQERSEALGQRQQDREHAMKLTEQRSNALKSYMGGDPSQLAIVDPEQYGKFEQMRMAQTRAAMDFGQNRIDALGRGAAAIQAGNSPDVVKQSLAQTGMFQTEDLGILDDPNAPAALPMMSEKFKSPTFPGEFQNAANRLGYGPQSPKGDYAKAWFDPGLARELEKEAKKSSGTTINNVMPGNQALEKSAKASLQKEEIDDQMMMQNLQILQGIDTDKYMTAAGRVKGWVLDNSEYFFKLDKDSAEFVDKRLLINQTANEIVNAYRKLITGAAAADKELKKIEATSISTELGPERFKAAIRRMVDKISRASRLRRRILGQGLDLNTEEGSKQYGTLLFGSKDDARSGADVKSRLNDLTSAGVAPDAAISQLVDEGYYTQEQADDLLLRAGGGG
jgi:hypothetical protein